MFVVALLLAYLLGSISFSYLVTYKLKGIDIRRYGSGNAGATNTLRVVGKGPAALVFLLDALKGMAAVGIGELFGGEPALLMATGVANRAVCQPEAVSLLKITRASLAPDALHRVPVWVPVF